MISCGLSDKPENRILSRKLASCGYKRPFQLTGSERVAPRDTDTTILFQVSPLPFPRARDWVCFLCAH